MILVPASQVLREYWPDVLHKDHTDWIWPFNRIPRWKTACFGQPPRRVEGNANVHLFWYKRLFTDSVLWKPCLQSDEGAEPFFHPKPIPDRGEWWRGDPDYYAIQTKSGWHYRRGWRWDDVDGYYQKSFKIGKYHYK